MDGLKQCEKGHFYEDNLDSCPHCPKGTVKLDENSTQMQGSEPKTDTTRTEVFGGSANNNQTPPTNVKRKESKSDDDGSFDPLKTTVTDSSKSNQENGSVNQTRRKLRGWLVSFDLAEYGIDFKVIEGRNTIGKAAKNDITVDDQEVSGSHAVLLCKHDEFMISDEMSTNGTFVNGEELQPRNPFNLSDGDKIKVGNTEFLFKTAF